MPEKHLLTTRPDKVKLPSGAALAPAKWRRDWLHKAAARARYPHRLNAAMTTRVQTDVLRPPPQRALDARMQRS